MLLLDSVPPLVPPLARWMERDEIGLNWTIEGLKPLICLGYQQNGWKQEDYFGQLKSRLVAGFSGTLPTNLW